jgi:hypothetical protein
MHPKDALLKLIEEARTTIYRNTEQEIQGIHSKCTSPKDYVMEVKRILLEHADKMRATDEQEAWLKETMYAKSVGAPKTTEDHF